MLLIMCLVLIGGSMSAFAYRQEPMCCDRMNVETRYEPGNPGTWIIKYCTNCGAIHSKKWVREEIY